MTPDLPPDGPRVALCHEWTTTWGGSEQVAARIARALNVDRVYVFAGNLAFAASLFPGRDVRISRLGRSSWGASHWAWLLPLMPVWWRSLDLAGYDAVVTSSHAAVNSVRAGSAAHVSYCYTPMRYAWNWRAELGRVPALLRPFWPAAASVLRRGDRRRAENVDLFVADSRNVARRILAFYGKRALVVYPPVNTDFFTPDASVGREDFYLVAGRFVAYKRSAMVLHAARRAGVRLIVAGSGPELDSLKKISGPLVEFCPQPTNDELRDLYRRSRAVVFAGVEDFGMVLVEAQACGSPVIAFGEGGALESVQDGVTGVLYDNATVEALADVLGSFDPANYDGARIRSNAERFAPSRFDAEIRDIVRRVAESSKANRSQVVSELLADRGA